MAATSSCEKLQGLSSSEFGELTLQPCVDVDSNDDDDNGEFSLRSPNVRAYVASFESQQHQKYQRHRQLCRTDDVVVTPR